MNLPPKHKPRSENGTANISGELSEGADNRTGSRGPTGSRSAERVGVPDVGGDKTTPRLADKSTGGKPPSVPPKTLSKQFAANPFDATMREPGPDGALVHTDLGMLVEIWHWYRMHMVTCGDSFQPIANSVFDHLQRKCPKVVADVKRIAGELSNQRNK